MEVGKKDKDKIIKDCIKLCKRVAKGQATCEKEVEIFPEVARMVLNYPTTQSKKNHHLS